MAKLKPLIIGDVTVPVPIVQGGMGVAVSTAPLASAVAECGGAGTIASVGLGYFCENHDKDFLGSSRQGLRDQIREARKHTQGVIGANILVAVSNYADLARTAVEEGIDFIVSGAGLPLKLPEYTAGSSVKIIPIVSSVRAADLIIRTWKKRYNRLPDAVVVEGPKAGGHLGFGFDELSDNTCHSLEDLVKELLPVLQGFEKEYKASIPLIAAGGIFTGADIAHFMRLGASAVQMATRFVATEECAVQQAFKDYYVRSTPDDVVIIKSPVGMPGRALRTSFVKRLEKGQKEKFHCRYRCLRSCNPEEVPYCIARRLFNAFKGDIEEAVVFAGSNVWRIDKIVSVKELMNELVAEAEAALDQS